MLSFKSFLSLVAVLAASLPAWSTVGAKEGRSEPATFISVLRSDGPAPDIAEELKLYGQFVGDWNTDIVTYTPDGARHEGKGEIHFGWILNGRAIQDVWMIPKLEDRRPDSPQMPVAGNWFGTTLRLYDPGIKGWRIYWLDPATNAYYQQLGHKQGPDIVQEGTAENGASTRWSFTEITANSFHWKGVVSTDKGTTWHLIVEVFAHRT